MHRSAGCGPNPLCFQTGDSMYEKSEPRCRSCVALPLTLFAAPILLLSGCSSSFVVTDPGYFARISAADTIRVNQQVQIQNNQKASGVPLIFSINGIPGGNAELGTID